MEPTNGELVNRVAKLRLDGQLGSASRSRVNWLPWILCIVLALTWAGVGIRSYKHASAPVEAAVEGTGEKPKTETPTVASGGIVMEVKGYIVPARIIAVSPIDVAGRVMQLNVIEGKEYDKDAILAVLEDTSFLEAKNEAEAQYESATKRLASAQAKLDMVMPKSVRQVEKDQVQAELTEAKALKARAADEVQRLAKLEVGTAAEKELRQAFFDLEASKARVQKLEATYDILEKGPRKEQISMAEADIAAALAEQTAAKARFNQAKWRFDNCTIRSPIKGTVLTKKAELFNLANPNAFSVGVAGGASGSICEMADLRELEVEVEIPERNIARLKDVKKCRVRADAYPDKVYEATLDRIMPTAVRAKSIVNVRVKIILPKDEVPGTFLKPEMSAVVAFLAN